MSLRKILAGFALVAVAAGATSPAPLAQAVLVRPDGSTAGTVRIREHSDGTIVELKVTGVAPGEHGLHLHTTGTCSGPDFASAGGHLDPAGHKHGARNAAGPHLGDLPNVTADASGGIRTELRVPTAASDLAANLFDADGSAIVLHAAADDYLTDPTGNSGARIACGVLTRP